MRVEGVVTPPGDKSISHRALVLASIGAGTSEIDGILTSLDARSMARVLRQLGVRVTPLRLGRAVMVRGRPDGFTRPSAALHCGNSGTAARFILGLLSGGRSVVRVTGDASLRRRPMRRVTRPLAMMGARFGEPPNDGLPITVRGATLQPLEYRMDTASAQVKGALLFAGLVGRVPVTLHEPALSRDHTERMLRALGQSVETNGLTVRLVPTGRIPAFHTRVPGDPSSAAFLVAAAVLATAGELLIKDVALNPTRTGFLRVIQRMGGRVQALPRGEHMGEPVGDLIAQPSTLRATTVASDEVPSLVDEIPILAVLASRAEGETVFHGVQELRVKESDRLALMAANLRAVGAAAEATADTLTVVGTDQPPRGRVNTAGDHRLAMAFAILGRCPGAAIQLSERASPAISYPAFYADLDQTVKR